MIDPARPRARIVSTLVATTAGIAALSSIVATGRAAPPTGHFTATADEVVDTASALHWQRALSADGHTQADAAAYCEGLVLAGSSDWRLPSLLELLSIVDERRRDPAIDPVFFPDTPGSRFWSSTPYAGPTEGAWSVSFADGTTFTDDYSSARVYRVRCVR